MSPELTPQLPHYEGASGSAPEQAPRPRPVSPTERIFQQIQAVDAWIAARRAWERARPERGLSRDQRMDMDRENEALRRTHDTIKGRCARGLNANIESMRLPAETAVIAHRHAWFVDKLTLLLGSHGVTVLGSTDNGAEALGFVVAEQPDILLVGDRLAMMTGDRLLTQSRLYSPRTLLATQAPDLQPAEDARTAADAVFLRHHPPALICDDLLALHHAFALESQH